MRFAGEVQFPGRDSVREETDHCIELAGLLLIQVKVRAGDFSEQLAIPRLSKERQLSSDFADPADQLFVMGSPGLDPDVVMNVHRRDPGGTTDADAVDPDKGDPSPPQRGFQ